MLEKIQNILIRKHQENTLANFYIVSAKFEKNLAKKTSFLELWMKEVLLKMTGLKKLDHPDILWMANEASEKDYSTAEFRESPFFKFLDLTPFSLKWRFIVIENAHKLGNIVSNMLLKSLEESGKNISIFLLNPSKEKLLSTVESRAIKISAMGENEKPGKFHLEAEILSLDISEKLKTQLNDFYQNKLPLFEILDALKSNKQDHESLLEFFLKKECANKKATYQDKETFLENLKHFKKSQNFHNSITERFLPFLKT